MPLWSELKRRNVVKVGAAYAVVAWLLIQVSSIVLTTFEAPPVANRVFLVFLILGFPVALLFAWAYELTPKGLARTSDVDPATSITRQTGQRLNYVIIAMLSLAVVLLVLDNYVIDDRAEASIAVLPFDNLSADAGDDRFVDGFTVEIHNGLSQIADLRVVALTSSMSFQGTSATADEIAARLGVDYLLEGGVNRSDDDVRVIARLIRADDQSNVWSRPFDRTLDNPRELQIEVAELVADRLSATFGIGDFDLQAGGTDNLEAYDHFLLAQGYAQRQDGRALAEYRRALSLDPDFGLAQVEVAYLIVWGLRSAGLALGEQDVVEQRAADLVEEAQAEVARARELMPDHPVLLLIDAWTMIDEFEWADAERLLRERLAQTGPSDFLGYNWLGNLLLQSGRMRPAIEYLEFARELDPINIGPNLQLGLAYTSLGDFERADALFEASRSLDGYGPTAVNPQYLSLLARGYEEQTRSLLREEGSVDADFNTELLDHTVAELRARRDEIGTQNPSLAARLAQVAAIRKEAELSFDIWQRLVPSAPLWLQFTWMPWMGEVRRHPEFPLLMRRMGLVRYWSERGWPEQCRPVDPEGFACD